MTHVRPNPLTPGVHVQIYLDSVHPSRASNWALRQTVIRRGLAELKAAGVVGVVWHSFTSAMTPAKFGDYAALADEFGLQSSASFGLGQTNSLHGTAAGEAMARVALHPRNVALVVDAESRFEDDPTDRANVTAMGVAFRALAPAKYVVTQPWPVPTLHTKFPEREFALWVDADARQAYYNAWTSQYGRQRYAKLNVWFAASQAVLAGQLGWPLARPQLITVQGYGWADIMPSLVDCLLRNPHIIAWSEPFPDVAFMRGLRAVKVLRETHGLTGLGAVRAFQIWSTAHGRPLVADDLCGPLTLAALGV